MGIENTMKRDRVTNGGIKMFSTEVAEVWNSVVIGVATGIFVALLFEFISWFKNRLARTSQIAYIRTFLHEQKELISEITDEDFGNALKGLPQVVIFEAALRQVEIIVAARSTNLTNDQRSEILRSLSGNSSMIEGLKAQKLFPDTKFLIERLQQIEDIEWLKVN